MPHIPAQVHHHHQWLCCLYLAVGILQSSVVNSFICLPYVQYARQVPFIAQKQRKYCSTNSEYVPSDNGRSKSVQISFHNRTDEEFHSWLTEELSDAPGRQAYGKAFDNAISAIVEWRKRYRGNPKLWKRLFKKERIFKELIESAPILHLVQKYVENHDDGDEEITILDLCSGKGYLSMFLSEILPPEKVSKIILIDKAWAMCNAKVLPHQMNWDHIYGNRTLPLSENEKHINDNIRSIEKNPTYFTTWPIPLHTSKQDLKQSCNPRQMKKYVFDRIDGPVLILAVHLCGTLALKAIDLFNANNNVKFFCLKPCCLPAMVYAKRGDTFKIGNHSFLAEEVCSNGKFIKKNWYGPPRWHLENKFHLWSNHLYKGIDVTNDGMDADVKDKKIEQESHAGRKEKREVLVQVDGGFQNTYLLAERSPLTADIW